MIKRARSGQVPSSPPDTEVESPDVDRSHSDSFLYRLMFEMREKQAATGQSLTYLTDMIDRQSQQMGKIDDLRVEMARLSTEISHLGQEVASTKTKLDTVRIWIAGAAAVVAVVVVVLVPLAARLWPSSAPSSNAVGQIERSPIVGR